MRKIALCIIAGIALLLAVSPPLDARGKKKREFKYDDAAVRAAIKNILSDNELDAEYEKLVNAYKRLDATGQTPQGTFQKVLDILADPLLMGSFSFSLTDTLEDRTSAGKFDFPTVIAALAEAGTRKEDKKPVILPKLPASADKIPAPGKGSGLDGHLGYLKSVLAETSELTKSAYPGSFRSPDEYAQFLDRIDALADAFVQHIYVEVVCKQVKGLKLKLLPLWDLRKKIDFAKLYAAGASVSSLIDPEYIFRMRKDLKKAKADTPPEKIDGATGKILFYEETDLGRVVVGGTGKNTYTGEFALVVDIGGSDKYTRAAAPSAANSVSIVIDLDGNDVYNGTKRSFAAGVGGVALLIDAAGNDRYIAADTASTRGFLNFGVGFFGVGIHADLGGNDYYTCPEYSCGTGAVGMGIQYDASGDDVRESFLYSHGVGAGSGIGVLIDGEGDDSYKSGGKYPSSYGTEGIYRGFSIGMGVGWRYYPQGAELFLGGGLGVLVDKNGDDSYKAGNFSMGTSYFYSLGILRDSSGNDTYNGTRYNQANGVHTSHGMLIDLEGNDRYTAKIAAEQGASWDIGVGWLFEGAGNDIYISQGGLVQGAVSQNGFAILMDLEGKDMYQADGYGQGGHGQNEYQGGRGAKSLGFLLDFGGGKDMYTRDLRKNDYILIEKEYGIFCDLNMQLKNAAKSSVSLKAHHVIPMPPPKK